MVKYFALALHNHQPIGNFDSVFAEAYAMSYLPMLEALERHPNVRVSLHNTGPLVEWLRQHRPDYLTRVKTLVDRGQLEVISGAYYEPIISSLPEADRVGQIKRMNRQVQEDFGYQAQGMWLAERVWEPSLPKYIAEAGIKYTILDDNHFKAVGLTDDDLYGYYMTEDQGSTVAVFATGQPLRYQLPWKPVEQVITWFGETLKDGQVAVMGDDGEKFGLWPGTFEYCYGDTQWVEHFFTALEQNQQWLQTIHLSQYMAEHPPIGAIYLQTASYIEMSEWSLPTELSYQFNKLLHELDKPEDENVRRFLRGGFWRNMMVKYPEINFMHKKMLRVSKKVYNMPAGPAREMALDHLWRGQCNCPYWHGLFGGIYYPHIRTGTFGELILAENDTDRLGFGSQHQVVNEGRLEGIVEAEIADHDCDGNNEVLLSGSGQNLYLAPFRGGTLFEWDLRARHFNLLNTMTRRQEPYHKTLTDFAARMQQHESQSSAGGTTADGQGENGGGGEVKSIHDIVTVKEQGLEGKLFYDWYQRSGLLDHFIDPATSLDDFYRAQYGERGDFVNQPYALTLEAASNHSAAVVKLERAGHVWDGPDFVPVTVQKVLRVGANSSEFSVDYRVTNDDSRERSFTFAIEQNFAMLSGHAPDSYYEVDGSRPHGAEADLAAMGESAAASSVRLTNGWFGVQVELGWDVPATLWRLPVETVQNSEAGFERVYQASCLLPHWPLALQAGESWSVTLRYKAAVIPGGADEQ